MTVKKVDGADVKWGTDGIYSVAKTCLSGTITRNPVKENIPNNTGGTRGYVFYEVEITASLEVLMDVTGTVPVYGDPITVDGETLYVMQVDKKAANSDFVKYTINAETTQTIKEGGSPQMASAGKPDTGTEVA